MRSLGRVRRSRPQVRVGRHAWMPAGTPAAWLRRRRRHALDAMRRRLQPPRHRRARQIASALGTIRSPGIASISRAAAASRRRPAARSSSPAAESDTSPDACMRLFVDERHVAAVVRRRETARTTASSARSSACFAATRTRQASVVGLDAGHPQLAHRRPQRLRQRRLIGERPEVAALLGRSSSSRMISAGPRPSSDGSMPRSTRNGAPMRSAMSSGVTKRRFSQFVPLERDALAERAADRVRRHEHPLGAGDVLPAQRGELGDEWIHVQDALALTRTSCRGLETRVASRKRKAHAGASNPSRGIEALWTYWCSEKPETDASAKCAERGT